jgi:hypothetical protein
MTKTAPRVRAIFFARLIASASSGTTLVVAAHDIIVCEVPINFAVE